MKRTATFTKAEIANQHSIKVDDKVTKANLIADVTSSLHPLCDNEYFADIADYINVIISYGHKVTMKKNGGLVFKVGRTSVCEIYRCNDSLVHIYVRDEKAVDSMKKHCKCYHTYNEKWCYPNRFEFTKDSLVDFVLSDYLHDLTDTF